MLTELEVAQRTIATQDVVIQGLRSDLSQVQKVAFRISNQLGKALYIHDDAWAYGYLEGLKRM